ncbi:Response regulator PleD [Candidatus Magnetaquicoccaceae bacterium FCR-1]|uniref:diguanylate cyclase n=1 Tax=Candidatus Magnetaquiglobus chichijimensis TaxID=3141448 RepID=A0ABQ0C607_9PROT
MARENVQPTVLVVDDEATNIEVLAKLLQPDHRVLFTTDPSKAMNLAEMKGPDLILLDVIMPNMDGYEVCRRLKSRASTRDIPVIFVTAMGEEQFEAIGFEAGGVDYITKPVKPFLLRARVKTHIDLKRQSDLLRRLASLDGLTGIPNRRSLDEFLRQEWHRGLRHESRLSAMLIDVDFFKKFNDVQGHQAGDVCLRQIAEALSRTLERKTDLVARYGGEEFACILPETPLQGAVHTAEKIKQAVASLAIPHPQSDVADIVTLSMGVISVTPKRGHEPEEILAAADQFLYMAKLSGRNQIQSGLHAWEAETAANA